MPQKMSKGLIVFIAFCTLVTGWGVYAPFAKTSLFGDAYDSSWSPDGPHGGSSLYRRRPGTSNFYFHK